MNRTAWWRYRSHEKRLAYVKEIRKPQCAFRSFENSGRRAPCKAVNLAGHVGLVGVTRKCPPIRKRLPVTLPLAQKQKSLKTKHRLKHLRTIANRGRKASMNLSVADAGQPDELPHSAMSISSKPAHTPDNGFVGWSSRSETARENLREGKSARRKVPLFPNTSERLSPAPAPKNWHRYRKVKQSRSRNAQNARCIAGAQAHSSDPGTTGKLRNKRIRPRSDHDRQFVVNETVVFARMRSGRDSPKTPALVISPLRPKRAACGASHTQTANLPSGCFLCEFEINRPIR